MASDTIRDEMRSDAAAGSARFRNTLDSMFTLAGLSASSVALDHFSRGLSSQAPNGVPEVQPMERLGILGDALQRSNVTFMAVIDGIGRPRGLFSSSSDLPPTALYSFLRAIPANADHRAVIQRLDREVFVVGVHAIPGHAMRVVLLSRWGKAQFDKSLTANGEGRFFAVADLSQGTVAASGSPNLVEAGTSLSDLDRDWLVMVEELPEHGGLHFLPAFVSLVPKSHVVSAADHMLTHERHVRSVLAMALIGLFMVIFWMLGRQLRSVIGRIAQITGTVTGLPQPAFQGGNEVQGLLRHVELLAGEVSLSRSALEQEMAERIRLNEEQLHVREENSRLRLLQAVTDLLKVGILKIQQGVPRVQNHAMEEFVQACGDVSVFVEGKERGDGFLSMELPGGGERIFQLRSADSVEEGMVLVTDVTEQRRAEQMIHSLALFPAQCPYPVLRIGGDGTILHANPASESLLGEWGTSMGRPIPQQWLGVVAEVMQTKRQVQAELPVAGKVLSLSLVPVAGGGYVNIYAGDVSDRVEVERQLALANEGLERRVAERTRDLLWAKEQAELASRSKTEFLATISHELRTPLNAIIGFSEVMAGSMFGPLGNPRYQVYASDIVTSGRHLLAVINDILDVSKVEAGQMSLDLGQVDMAEVVDSAIRLVESRARGGQISLTTHVSENLPQLFGDRRRCLQILVNLLSNAVKFTPEGGKVTLSARREDKGITLEVRDTGIGMTEDEIALALEPFRQVDGSLSRQYEGTGLGLPLAKSMTELHGGALTIASAKGRGTTVSVWLPCHPAEQAEDWEI
ncbi:MAG: PAS domain-containing sensor histidine kinase [Magnetospirillum sp.]|nr:PAS domain-containing sensor histidine kinase [Magnetospirillum sp.]